VRPLTLIALAATSLALAACAASAEAPVRAHATLATAATSAAATAPAAAELPPRGRLAARAARLKGPRVMTETTHGRPLVMYGNTSSRSRLLIAGCVNDSRCAGTDVVNTALLGCPPTDTELWYFPTLVPNGDDLDATPAHPGAAAWRQAVADLRPTTTIVFRRGPIAVVRGSGAAVPVARRYARIAGLPFRPDGGASGLAGWTGTVRPRTAAFTVELPGERVSARKAVRLAYAIDRLAGTRFAAGALSERLHLIADGRDPRAFWH
jgi:hypothetical protein